jgi:nitrite reductase/ring-hydroxylating ferredoxin subunit
LPGWTYSLETGEATRGGGKLQLYVTEVDDGAVWIRLPGTRHDQQT